MPFLAYVPSALSVIVRFRHAKADERQQLKWFAYAAGLLVVFFVANDFLFPLVGDLLFIVGIALLPISVVIAILRHRLFDIDILINRTLVYGALTVGLHWCTSAACLLQQLFARCRQDSAWLLLLTLSIGRCSTPYAASPGFIDKPSTPQVQSQALAPQRRLRNEPIFAR